MKKALLDTNIILDIALRRTPHYEHAVSLFEKVDQNTLSVYISATTITDIYYIAKKEVGAEKSRSFISDLIQIADILPIDKMVVEVALSSKLSDFEDAIQDAAATLSGMDYIISRNAKDFENSMIEALTAEEFLLRHPIL